MKKLFSKYDEEICPKTLRGWRKKGQALRDWLLSRRIPDEPGISWIDLHHLFSRHFYQKKPVT
ncbi:MAG: hypothetical protein ABIK28_03855 [Planctomycetota bacterium]